MNKGLKIALGIIMVPYLIIVVLLTICLLNYNDYNVTEFKNSSLVVVENTALEPDYNKGSLVVVKKNDYKDIKVGDKIFFYDTYQSKISINLAKVEKTEKVTDNEYTFTVEGNHPISSKYFIGKSDTSKSYSTLGTIMSVLASRIGYLLIVVLPILVVFIIEIYAVVKEMKTKEKNA